jgi:tripartite-type tricarboxylate transporter receptor subunit TctC
VTGAKRFTALPDLPTVAEAGAKDFEADQWLGVLLPRGTASAITNRFRAEINKALASDALRATLTSNGMSVAESESQAQFAEYVRAELVKWVQVVKVGNIKPE